VESPPAGRCHQLRPTSGYTRRRRSAARTIARGAREGRKQHAHVLADRERQKSSDRKRKLIANGTTDHERQERSQTVRKPLHRGRAHFVCPLTSEANHGSLALVKHWGDSRNWKCKKIYRATIHQRPTAPESRSTQGARAPPALGGVAALFLTIGRGALPQGPLPRREKGSWDAVDRREEGPFLAAQPLKDQPLSSATN